MSAHRLSCASLLRVCGLGLALCVPGMAALPLGRITGNVQTANGKAVRGAVVTAAPIVPPADGSMGRATRAISAADGTFVLDQVPAGQYWICAAVAGSQLLDPCQWSASPVTVTLSDESTHTGVAITLQKGTFIHIRVDDSAHLLRPIAKSGIAPAPFFVKMWGLHGPMPVMPLFDDDNGRTFRAVVPFDTPVRLRTIAPNLQVADQTGKMLQASDLNQQLTVEKNDPPVVLHYSVSKAVGQGQGQDSN